MQHQDRVALQPGLGPVLQLCAETDNCLLPPRLEASAAECE